MYVKLNDINNDYKEEFLTDNNKSSHNSEIIKLNKIILDYKEYYYNHKLILLIIILTIIAISLNISKIKIENTIDELKQKIK